MRRFKLAVCLLFIVAAVLCVGEKVKTRMFEDHTPPVITCEEDMIQISVQAEKEEQEKALMEGVTATDNRDGDLTDSIRISSMSHFLPGNKRTVTYVVFDSSNQVGTLQRTVQYTDYTHPQIHLTQPLRVNATKFNGESLTEYMTATDCIDGDLTNQIHLEFSDAMYTVSAGEYSVTAQVSNSAGDVRSIPMTFTLVDDSDRQEYYKEYPMLSEYIVYTTVGSSIDPMSYYSGVMVGSTEYTNAIDPVRYEEVRDGIWVSGDVDYNTAGVYPVELNYTGASGVTATTKMYIVVEEPAAAETGAKAETPTENTESAEEGNNTEQEGEQNE